jgi:hypothetical protein
MFKLIVLYPFLFIVYIVLIPLVNNLDQVAPAQTVRPLVLLLVLSGAILALLAWLLHDRHYAGYLTFLLLAFQFLFGHQWRLIQDEFVLTVQAKQILLGIWAVLLIVLALPRVWKRMGGGEHITPLLNLLFGAAILIQILFALPGALRDGTRLVSANADIQLPGGEDKLQLDCSQRPDIYYIVLDAYGRSDKLADYYGVDNTAFLQSLREKGFFVADRAYTNYIQTIFSLASSLNMEYIEPNPPQVSGADYFGRLIAMNKLARLLQEYDYQTIAFESGFFFSDHLAVDLFIRSESPLTEFENLLIADTPISMLLDVLSWMKQEHGYQAHGERVLFAFKQLGALAKDSGPKFVFAHILSPHPPFIFDAQGQRIEPSRSYSISDGDDYRGSWPEYQQGYAGQVQFVNSLLETTIDQILSDSANPPVIVIQGDHGPGSHLDWHSPAKTCLAERTPILNALYLPGDSSDQPYPEISPVNSFRLILNRYFGAGLELLPDETYFTSGHLDRQVIDITSQRDSTANCPPIITEPGRPASPQGLTKNN